MREFDLLKHIFRANRELGSRVLIPPGDDLALVAADQSRILVGVDQLIDGRHVNVAATPIELVGRKAVARSLSDIAAMAGEPLCTLVAAALPPDFGEERAMALFESMRTTAAQHRCPLVGGDLAFHRDPSHPLVCSVTVLAAPSHQRAIPRSGARPGDVVCVTGPLGGSLEPNGLGRHLTFEPRIDLAIELAKQLGERLHAMIDISDGLGRDVSHIARMSEVRIELDAVRLPCNPGCDWRRALGDGEDYELCFAVSPPAPKAIKGVTMHEIGVVLPRDSKDDRAVVVKVGGELIDIEAFGWQHESASP